MHLRINALRPPRVNVLVPRMQQTKAFIAIRVDKMLTGLLPNYFGQLFIF